MAWGAGALGSGAGKAAVTASSGTDHLHMGEPAAVFG